MSEGKAIAGARLQPDDFEQFKEDLDLLLKAFPAQQLADWMKKNKGNLSKKINGIEPITPKFLRDFYRFLQMPIARLKQGVPPHTIEQEMAGLPKEENNTLVQLQLTLYDIDLNVKIVQREMVEIRDEIAEETGEIEWVKIVLKEHEVMIKALQTMVFRSGEAADG